MLKDLPTKIRTQFQIVERDQIKQSESSIEMRHSPTRLTLQQVAKLQQMAIASGLQNYNI